MALTYYSTSLTSLLSIYSEIEGIQKLQSCLEFVTMFLTTFHTMDVDRNWHR